MRIAGAAASVVDGVAGDGEGAGAGVQPQPPVAVIIKRTRNI
jgi:hypothetical protein